jgi:hypothetical protein
MEITLKDGGHLIVSELCWFESPLPDELRTYWEANYPAISTEEEIRIFREYGSFYGYTFFILKKR